MGGGGCVYYSDVVRYTIVTQNQTQDLGGLGRWTRIYWTIRQVALGHTFQMLTQKRSSCLVIGEEHEEEDSQCFHEQVECFSFSHSLSFFCDGQTILSEGDGSRGQDGYLVSDGGFL